MSKLPKTLEAKREATRLNTPFYEDNYNSGFDAACDILLPVMREMADALQKYGTIPCPHLIISEENAKFHKEIGSGKLANDALKSYTELVGGSDE